MVFDEFIKMAGLIPTTSDPLPTRVRVDNGGNRFMGPVPLGSKPIEDNNGNVVGYDWSHLTEKPQSDPVLDRRLLPIGKFTFKPLTRIPGDDISTDREDDYQARENNKSWFQRHFNWLAPTADLASGNLVKYPNNASMRNLKGGYATKPGNVVSAGEMLLNGRTDIPVYDASYNINDGRPINVKRTLPDMLGSWSSAVHDNGYGVRMPDVDPTTRGLVMSSGIVGTFDGDGQYTWEKDMKGKPVTTLDNLFNALLNPTPSMQRHDEVADLLKQSIGDARKESIKQLPDVNMDFMDNALLNKMHPLALPITVGNSAGELTGELNFSGPYSSTVGSRGVIERDEPGARHFLFNGIIPISGADGGASYNTRTHTITLPKTSPDYKKKLGTVRDAGKYVDLANTMIADDMPMNSFYSGFNQSGLSALLHEGTHAMTPYQDSNLANGFSEQVFRALTDKSNLPAIKAILKAVLLKYDDDYTAFMKNRISSLPSRAAADWNPTRDPEFTWNAPYFEYEENHALHKYLKDNPKAQELLNLLIAQLEQNKKPGIIPLALGIVLYGDKVLGLRGYALSQAAEMFRAMHEYKMALTNALMSNPNLTPLQVVEKVLDPKYALGKFLEIAPPLYDTAGLPIYNIPENMTTAFNELELSRAIKGLHKAWYGPAGPFRDKVDLTRGMFSDQGNPPLISPLLQRKVLEHLWPQVRNNNNPMQNPNVKMASVKK